MKRRRMRWRWSLVASAVATFVSVVAMVRLPGRTASHRWVDAAEASAAPSPEGFVIGDLRWDLVRLQADPRLEPLRSFMASVCPGRDGLHSAVCLSNELSRRFANAPPTREFFDASYDPAVDLQSHLAGEPGHCTTRSGLSASILLASGIPARQVQITAGLGHNVLEVYDAKLGWVIFDPTFGVAYAKHGDTTPISARDAVTVQKMVPVSLGMSSSDLSDAPHEVRDAIYPDPWLYTRSGRRAARWPFRGRFVHIGSPTFGFGLGQEIARTAFIASALATLGSGILLVRSRRRARGRAAAPKEDAKGEVVVSV